MRAGGCECVFVTVLRVVPSSSLAWEGRARYRSGGAEAGTMIESRARDAWPWRRHDHGLVLRSNVSSRLRVFCACHVPSSDGIVPLIGLFSR